MELLSGSLWFIGFFAGFGFAALALLLFGVYTIGPTERGVITTFGRVQRTRGTIADDPLLAPLLNAEEIDRYNYPLIRVTPPGGPYFKWPWQRLHRIGMTIQTTDIIWDPDIQQDTLQAVTKDNLTIVVNGQIRWKPCERNLYPFLFGVAHPTAHVMGYFISVLRDRIATFHSENLESGGAVEGISINDLRKNLSSINHYMEDACRKTAARYGIELDAALITTIDAPREVDEALASINTTQNQVAAAISQAKADADQKLTMAQQAVEIARNRADAEAAPLRELAHTLQAMHATGGKPALDSYVRNAFLALREKAAQTIMNS
jgi:regulator of protease activity HflC (stomatin/prohibitin superfamily)